MKKLHRSIEVIMSHLVFSRINFFRSPCPFFLGIFLDGYITLVYYRNAQDFLSFAFATSLSQHFKRAFSFQSMVFLYFPVLQVSIFLMLLIHFKDAYSSFWWNKVTGILQSETLWRLLGRSRCPTHCSLVTFKHPMTKLSQLCLKFCCVLFQRQC